jgi:hypothetical protein
MNANDLTFGIEIETIAPTSAIRDHGLDIGSYYHGRQVPYLPAGWIAKSDSSIRTTGSGVGCEIVSPVLRGEEGIRQVLEVVKTLEEKGHRVNASCGVHIHVGWDPAWGAERLARLITIVAYLEKALFAITGTKNRERGTWCGGVRKYGKPDEAKKNLDERRYHALNLTNLARGRRNAVEFRIFSGSLNATKILGWIQVCLGIVERAANGKRSPAWEPKPATGGWAKKGPGQSETERLMGYLAWGAGYARIHNGQQFGWISDAIPQDEVKAEFRRLARKYDAQI